MSDSKEGTRGLVAGVTRMGKSYFVKKEMIPNLVKYKPVVVFDRKEEYAGKFAADNDKKWIGCSGFIDLVDKVINRGGVLQRKVYIVNCRSDQDYITGLYFFLRLQKPVALVLDEAHDIFLDRDFYDAKKNLVKMIRYGSSFGIDIVLITQRTMDIPPDIRSQFPWIISFKQRHETDVKTVDKMGFPGADELSSLQKREKILFGDLPDHLKKGLSSKQLKIID